MTSAEAYNEMKATFGLVPEFLRAYPEASIPGAWTQFKSIALNPKTALSGRLKELTGLAVASQIPCAYCVHFHTEAAKLHGATEQDIREAIAVASCTRHWSTYFHGIQLDQQKFREEIALILKHLKGGN